MDEEPSLPLPQLVGGYLAEDVEREAQRTRAQVAATLADLERAQAELRALGDRGPSSSADLERHVDDWTAAHQRAEAIRAEADADATETLRRARIRVAEIMTSYPHGADPGAGE